jgi:uncharacterized protein YndB with AHSA1/START domain
MKVQLEELSPTEPTIVMTRSFNAPRDLVWEAFTDPKYVAQWYGGHHFSSPSCEMDVREGGIWRHTMKTPSGAEFALEFVYLVVRKPEKLVWRNNDARAREKGLPQIEMTVTLEDAGEKTNWKLVARFASIAERDHVAKTEFAKTIDDGSEKLDAIVKSLHEVQRD